MSINKDDTVLFFSYGGVFDTDYSQTTRRLCRVEWIGETLVGLVTLDGRLCINTHIGNIVKVTPTKDNTDDQ